MRETTRGKLHVEQLEDRCVPAGNVIAAVVDHNLIVIGDAQDNNVMILQTVQGVQVVGDPGDPTSVPPAAPTTVNGSQAPFTAVGLTKDVYISMGAGNDILTAAFNSPRNLVIDMGPGDDAVSFGGFFEPPPQLLPNQVSVNVAGNLTVLMGDGNDSLAILEAQVGRNTLISLGQGDNSFFESLSTFGGSTAILSGAGADTLSLSATAFNGDTAILTGGGDDFLDLETSTFSGLVVLDGGDGNDTLINYMNAYATPPTILGFETQQ